MTHAHTRACTRMLSHSELVLSLGQTQSLQCCINKCHLHYLKWLHVTERERAERMARALWTEQKAFGEFQHSLAGKLWKYTQRLYGVLMCASSGPQLTARARSGYREVSSPKPKIWYWVLKLIQSKLPFQFFLWVTLMTTLVLPAMVVCGCGIQDTTQL